MHASLIIKSQIHKEGQIWGNSGCSLHPSMVAFDPSIMDRGHTTCPSKCARCVQDC